MPTLRKQFLTAIRKSWAKEFPFLKPVEPDDVQKSLRGATFLCDAYADARKRFYFVHFSFPPKMPGEFTMGATVSDSSRQSVQDPAGPAKLSPLNIGGYSIAAFLGVQFRSWMLYDWEAKNIAYWQSLGASMPETGIKNLHNVWKPTSFDLPAEQIIMAAIADVNGHLTTHIFPKLEIDYRKLAEDFRS